jgi:hypothetical protein
MKKAGNSVNFAAGVIINGKTYHNSLCRDKNKHKVTNYVTVYKETSRVMPSHMRELSPAHTLVA